MSRQNPVKPGQSFGGPNRVLGDEPPAEPYLRDTTTTKSPVPGRSQPARIGAACPEARQTAAPPAFTEELRSGVPVNGNRGNDTPAATKTFAENVDARREARGIRTRPSRPGQWV
jgi:hypothetical protein